MDDNFLRIPEAMTDGGAGGSMSSAVYAHIVRECSAVEIASAEVVYAAGELLELRLEAELARFLDMLKSGELVEIGLRALAAERDAPVPSNLA